MTSRVIFYGFIVVMGIIALAGLAKPARAVELTQEATNNGWTPDWVLLFWVGFILLLSAFVVKGVLMWSAFITRQSIEGNLVDKLDEDSEEEDLSVIPFF